MVGGVSRWEQRWNHTDEVLVTGSWEVMAPHYALLSSFVMLENFYNNKLKYVCTQSFQPFEYPLLSTPKKLKCCWRGEEMCEADLKFWF